MTLEMTIFIVSLYVLAMALTYAVHKLLDRVMRLENRVRMLEDGPPYTDLMSHDSDHDSPRGDL